MEQNLFNLNEIIESALKEYKIHNFLYDSKIVVYLHIVWNSFIFLLFCTDSWKEKIVSKQDQEYFLII